MRFSLKIFFQFQRKLDDIKIKTIMIFTPFDEILVIVRMSGKTDNEYFFIYIFRSKAKKTTRDEIIDIDSYSEKYL